MLLRKSPRFWFDRGKQSIDFEQIPTKMPRWATAWLKQEINQFEIPTLACIDILHLREAIRLRKQVLLRSRIYDDFKLASLGWRKGSMDWPPEGLTILIQRDGFIKSNLRERVRDSTWPAISPSCANGNKMIPPGTRSCSFPAENTPLFLYLQRAISASNSPTRHANFELGRQREKKSPDPLFILRAGGEQWDDKWAFWLIWAHILPP